MDYFLFQQINGLAGQWELLDAFGIFFAKYFGYILIALVFFIFLRKRRVIFQSFLAAILVRFGIVELIRWLCPRPRPFVENDVNLIIDKIDQPAFPSGHAAFFFTLSFIIYHHNKKAGIGFFVASFLISISRVFCGIHWPSDIIAGALVGIFSGWLIILFSRRFFSTAKK